MNIKELKKIVSSNIPLQKKYAHVYCVIDEMQCRRLALSCAYVVRDNPDVFSSENIIYNDIIKLAEQYVNGEITKQQMLDINSHRIMWMSCIGIFAFVFCMMKYKKRNTIKESKLSAPTTAQLNEMNFRDTQSIMVSCVFNRLIADNGFDTYESCTFALMLSLPHTREKSERLLLGSLKKFIKSLPNDL